MGDDLLGSVVLTESVIKGLVRVHPGTKGSESDDSGSVDLQASQAVRIADGAADLEDFRGFCAIAVGLFQGLLNEVTFQAFGCFFDGEGVTKIRVKIGLMAGDH